MKELQSSIKILKILLIFLTIIQIAYIIIVFGSPKLWIELDFNYKANWIIGAFHLMVACIFIWFNCYKMPFTKKVKTNNTLMIIFLGILGMWLWLPNKND